MANGTRVDHNKFCLHEEWTQVKNARGGAVGHHVTYELLVGTEMLRTRISRPVNADVYGAKLWSVILRDQLKVTEPEFWDCARDKVKPGRSTPAPPPAASLPASLVYQLITIARVPQEEVAQMTLVEAAERMAEHWSRPTQG